jgi:hypothetical protein
MKWLKGKLVVMNKTLIVLLILVSASSCAMFQPQVEIKEVEKTYTNKDEIAIDVSPMSRYTITASSDQNVHIHVRYADDPTVQYTIDETDRALRLGDKDLNYHPKRPTPRDKYQWKLELPKNMKVTCYGGIARLNVDSFDGSISVATGIGQMTFKRSRGMFNISTELGDIRFDQCEGTFNVSGVQADIGALRIVIEDESKFLTNGGDIKVVLAKTPRHNITITTGTGRGLLDYNGNTIVGSFKFSAEKGKGRIVSPYRFEKQTTYRDDLKIIRDQKDEGKKVDYLLKEQVIGSSSPEILIKTIRGSAVLSK